MAQHISITALQATLEPEWMFHFVQPRAVIQPVQLLGGNVVFLDKYAKIEKLWMFPSGTRCWAVHRKTINQLVTKWLQHYCLDQEVIFVEFPKPIDGYIGFLAATSVLLGPTGP